MERIAEEYYENQINDSSIEIRCISPAGEASIHTYLDGRLAIFKNGILYDVRNIINIGIPVINVPNDLAEKDWKDYITTCIRGLNTQNAQDMIIENIKEGTEESLGVEVPNGYTLTCNINGDILDSCIIIRESSKVQLEDKETNVKLISSTDVINSNTVLEVKEVKSGEAYNAITESLKNVSNKFVAYDITLKSDGVEIQPNGNVQISLPIPSGYDTSKVVVFRVESDGTIIKYDTKIEDNYAIIETNHFSNYIIVEQNVSNATGTDKTPIQNGEKDDTPKTGAIQYIGLAGIVIALSSIGIIALRNKGTELNR